MNSLPSLWSPKSFSLLCSFTALVERGETLERVPTGKQTHREKVAVRLRPRLDRASILNRLITILGQLTYVAHSDPQHVRPDQTHRSGRAFHSTHLTLRTKPSSPKQAFQEKPFIQAGTLLQMLPFSN